jgi:hypothetical protein
MRTPGLLLTILITAGAACGSEEVFDPALVDLSGDWLFYEANTAYRPPPELISNECRIRDMPLTIVRDPDNDRWLGHMKSGGTIQCEINGDWGERVPVDPPGSLIVDPLRITKDGLDVVMSWGGVSDTLYWGKLDSANSMSGSINPRERGRDGTWFARRR